MSEVLPKDERFRFANKLIVAKEITTIEDLYKTVPRKIVALGLGLNVTSFTNVKSKSPENFKLAEIIKLAELLEVDVLTMFNIFLNSLNLSNNKA
jgi:hypothetical protein